MKRALPLLLLCAVFSSRVVNAGPAAAPPPVACLGEGAESYLKELLDRIRELERDLEEERRARLAERSEFNQLLEKTRAEDRARFDSVTSEIRAQCSASAAPAPPSASESSRREPQPVKPRLAAIEKHGRAHAVEVPPPADRELRRGDKVTIRVANAKRFDRTVAVSPAGTLELPLVGSVPAAGRTAAELVESLTEKLSKFVKDPQVDIVAHPGDASRDHRR